MVELLLLASLLVLALLLWVLTMVVPVLVCVPVPVPVSVVVIIISQVWGIIPRIKGVLELVPLVLLQFHGNLLVMGAASQQ